LCLTNPLLESITGQGEAACIDAVLQTGELLRGARGADSGRVAGPGRAPLPEPGPTAEGGDRGAGKAARGHSRPGGRRNLLRRIQNFAVVRLRLARLRCVA